MTQTRLFSSNDFLQDFPKAKRLLAYVMNGMPDESQQQLQSSANPSHLILTKISGKEKCGREWKSVSALEFACWAGDFHLVKLLLQSVAKEDIEEAMMQIMNVVEHGTEHGIMLSPYHALLDAYAKYNAAPNSTENFKAIARQQFMLPIVGLQYFCDPEYISKFPLPVTAPKREITTTYVGKYAQKLLPMNTSQFKSDYALYQSNYVVYFAFTFSGKKTDAEPRMLHALCEGYRKNVKGLVDELRLSLTNQYPKKTS